VNSSFIQKNFDGSNPVLCLEKKDFSPVVALDSYAADYIHEHLNALESASKIASKDQYVPAVGQEIDLIQAASALNDQNSVDKILLLVRHGEAEHDVFERNWKEAGNDPNQAISHEDYPHDPFLTPKVSTNSPLEPIIRVIFASLILC